MFGVRRMNTELTPGDHFVEVNPGDSLYRDLQRRRRAKPGSAVHGGQYLG